MASEFFALASRNKEMQSASSSFASSMALNDYDDHLGDMIAAAERAGDHAAAAKHRAARASLNARHSSE